MPFIRISYVRENLGADAEDVKTRISDKVTQVVADAMGVTPGDVWVVFDDIGAAEFYVGPKSVAEMRRNKS